MNCLVVVDGWLGDALFASSVAERLIKESQYDAVDYLIGFPQTYPILECNPYIRNVIISTYLGPAPFVQGIESNYDAVFHLPVNDLAEPPTVKYQRACGVKSPTLGYHLEVPHQFERAIISQNSKVLFNGRKNVGLCAVWKTYNESLYNPTELAAELEETYNVFAIGMPIDQFSGATEVNAYVSSAAICKYLDYVIGAEGGLTNLAAGMGTKVIYTTDFTYGLFGPTGSHRQYSDPLKRIGPKAFFPNHGHVALSPDLDYKELPTTIRAIVQ